MLDQHHDGLDEPQNERCPILRCPVGLPQRSVACLAYREREPGRLQLRVVVSPDEGICDAVVEECADRVYVRVVMCYDEDEGEAHPNDSLLNCPVHVYLERPLGDRTVIDALTGEVLPLFVPTWG